MDRVRLEDPEELGDYFVKAFDLEEDRDEFDDIALKMKRAEKMEQLLEEENKLRFVLLKMYRSVYICGNCQGKTAAQKSEATASRRNYFRERARDVLSLKKYKLQCSKKSSM